MTIGAANVSNSAYFSAFVKMVWIKFMYKYLAPVLVLQKVHQGND